jgi:mannose/cellobiose epimerase-like protein (N-acyl-D-glucosamine 2-epimerase family)
MGVRPPPQRDDGGPEIVAFGIAALDEHLERADVTFPIASDELLETLGDPSVPYDAAGSEMRLSEALDATPHSTFETRQECMNALHPVFEERRERANNSLVGQLRSLLPFGSG